MIDEEAKIRPTPPELLPDDTMVKVPMAVWIEGLIQTSVSRTIEEHTKNCPMGGMFGRITAIENHVDSLRISRAKLVGCLFGVGMVSGLAGAGVFRLAMFL